MMAYYIDGGVNIIVSASVSTLRHPWYSVVDKKTFWEAKVSIVHKCQIKFCSNKNISKSVFLNILIAYFIIPNSNKLFL